MPSNDISTNMFGWYLIIKKHRIKNKEREVRNGNR